MAKAPYFLQAPITQPSLGRVSQVTPVILQALPDANAIFANINGMLVSDLPKACAAYYANYASKLALAIESSNKLAEDITYLAKNKAIADASINNLKSNNAPKSLLDTIAKWEAQIRGYVGHINSTVATSKKQLSYVSEVLAIVGLLVNAASSKDEKQARFAVFQAYLFGFDVANFLDAYYGLDATVRPEIGKASDLIFDIISDEHKLLGSNSFAGKSQAAIDKASLEQKAKDKKNSDQIKLVADLYAAAEASVIPEFLKKVLWNLSDAGTEFVVNSALTYPRATDNILAAMQRNRDNLVYKIYNKLFSTPESVSPQDAEIIEVFGGDSFTKDDVLAYIAPKTSKPTYNISPAPVKPPIPRLTYVNTLAVIDGHKKNSEVLKTHIEDKSQVEEDAKKRAELENTLARLEAERIANQQMIADNNKKLEAERIANQQMIADNNKKLEAEYAARLAQLEEEKRKAQSEADARSAALEIERQQALAEADAQRLAELEAQRQSQAEMDAQKFAELEEKLALLKLQPTTPVKTQSNIPLYIGGALAAVLLLKVITK